MYREDMADDAIELIMPGNRVHHLSEILAELCYYAHKYYDEEPAEEAVDLIEPLFQGIEKFMLMYPQFRTPEDSLSSVNLGQVSGAMLNRILDFGSKLCWRGSFIDSYHDKPIDVASTLNHVKVALRNHKIKHAVLSMD
ncbi:hypothetical protein [Pontibacter chinhatensis]|uniref:Uncharacterized protein n=1 Tax=Pontibacter chinhatensis TaxID=1436961 RepID=A0A1I2ZUV9_9BACT|nr:hypothetical protein [Pontibacter chinhatensis]SFH40871.1 hypothetical protein SAMN05421739_11827 [Pontibacter chinhatensis]